MRGALSEMIFALHSPAQQGRSWAGAEQEAFRSAQSGSRGNPFLEGT